MKTAEVNFANLLEQLSEERINLVVDGNAVVAGHSGSCHSSSSESGPAAVSSSEVPGRGLGL
jgi:hypothetical protein